MGNWSTLKSDIHPTFIYTSIQITISSSFISQKYQQLCKLDPHTQTGSCDPLSYPFHIACFDHPNTHWRKEKYSERTQKEIISISAVTYVLLDMILRIFNTPF
jgi:hypothetical protein